jgi:hypothetical protein
MRRVNSRSYFERETNPLHETVFLIVWIVVGVLQIIAAVQGM